MARRMILNYIVGTQGYPWEAWRHPDMQVERVTGLDFYLEQARLAEQGCFDTLFLIDHLALFPTPDAPLFWTLDPVQLMTALAVHTEHIGLIATIGTSFTNPYAVARQLATLDHLSNGRAGWNVVTSASDQEARNHGQAHELDRETRYRRAREFVDACLQLWHAWDADAVSADKERLSPVDTDKIRAINYEGREIRVRGPLGTPRSPQTVPIICQAGPSTPARDLAGRYADLVYSHYDGPEGTRSYRADLRARAVAAGRGAEAIKLIPHVMVFVKSTEAEARRLHRDLVELSRGAGRAMETDQREVLVGTPEHVADQIATGFERGEYDGVSIGVPLVPDALRDVVELVVPRLQDRGVHQRQYEPGTLRDRLHLPLVQTVDTDRWTTYYPA